jgi:hypothetical protein
VAEVLRSDRPAVGVGEQGVVILGVAIAVTDAYAGLAAALRHVPVLPYVIVLAGKLLAQPGEALGVERDGSVAGPALGRSEVEGAG